MGPQDCHSLKLLMYGFQVPEPFMVRTLKTFLKVPICDVCVFPRWFPGKDHEKTYNFFKWRVKVK